MLARVRDGSSGFTLLFGFGSIFSFVTMRFSGWKEVTRAKERGVLGSGARVGWLVVFLLTVVVVVVSEVGEGNSYVCELRMAITFPVGVRP